MPMCVADLGGLRGAGNVDFGIANSGFVPYLPEEPVMSEDLPRAEHGEMDSRETLAKEFFDATHAELTPFVSDEATWYDFDYLESDELVALLRSHYGVAPDETTLALPFWKLLDYLAANRAQTDR
jgi:hypothetical protein